MVTEAQHKTLIDECKQWYAVLALYREKINKLKTELYFFAPGKTALDTVTGKEHYNNKLNILLTYE